MASYGKDSLNREQSTSIDRREFVGRLAGGAAALALAGRGVAQAADSESPKHVLGAQLYTVRQSTKTIADLREALKKVARIGYTAVQASGLGPMDPKEVADAAKEAGVAIAAIHADWPGLCKDTDRVIAEMKLFQCEHAAIGGLRGEYHTLDGIKRFAGELPPVAEKLAANGITFSYHNHAHELARCGKKTWLETLYEQIDPKHLKAEIDTHWIQRGGGDPAAWVRRYPGRQPLLHLKDMAVTPRGEPRFAEIGEGNMNWPAILDAAKAAGVRWYLVEHDDCYGRDPFESLAISYRNLREMGLS